MLASNVMVAMANEDGEKGEKEQAGEEALDQTGRPETAEPGLGKVVPAPAFPGSLQSAPSQSGCSRTS